MNTKRELPELLALVKEFALANYETGGFSTVYECFSDEELLEVIGTARTPEKAYANIKKAAKAIKRIEDIKKENCDYGFD